MFDALDVFDDLLHARIVKGQRFRCIVENADVVHDEPERLSLVIDAIDAADGLEERVVFHGLVEVHALEDRRVKARQELRRDDDELQR